MIGRTMSYLSLTVVAAAVFLVSGCVPPIDAPDSGEQVRAVEAERIEKLEQDVAKAVAAVEPGRMQQQKDEVVAKAVAAVGPEHLKKYLPGLIEGNSAIQKAIRDIVCIRRGTVTLRDVGQFPHRVKNLQDSLPEELKPSDREKTRWNQEETVYTLGYKDMTRSKYEKILSEIADWAKKRPATITLDDVGPFQHDIEKLEKSLTGPIRPSNTDRNREKTVYTLRYENLGDLEYDQIVKKIGQWAVSRNVKFDIEHEQQVVIGQQADFVDCIPQKKVVDVTYVAVPGVAGGATDQHYAVSIKIEVKDVLAVSSVLLVAEDNHWLYPDDRSVWSKGPVPSLNKVFGVKREIEKDKKVWSIHIKGERREDPRISDKNQTVYVLIAREHPVEGYSRPFEVVQYRKVEIERPTGTFEDKQIPLEQPTLQPACPPEEIPLGVRNQFTDFLTHEMKWKEVDKVTNLSKWEGCKKEE